MRGGSEPAAWEAIECSVRTIHRGRNTQSAEDDKEEETEVPELLERALSEDKIIRKMSIKRWIEERHKLYPTLPADINRIKSSLMRFMFYIGIIIASNYIHNLVDEFLYISDQKILCPAFGSVSNCEVATSAGLFGMVSGYVLISLLLLKSTDTLKHNRILNSLEHMICAAQVPVQISLFAYFFYLTDGAFTGQDTRVLSFLTFFLLNALFFANNCLLSYLEFIATE